MQLPIVMIVTSSGNIKMIEFKYLEHNLFCHFNKMNRLKISPLFSKHFVRAFFFTGIILWSRRYQVPEIKFWNNRVCCFGILPSYEKPLNNLVSQVIRIVDNDSVVGYGYCFTDNIFVTTRYLLNKV